MSSYNDISKLARSHGFSFWKMGKGSHEIWRNSRGETLLLSRGSKSLHSLRKFKAQLKKLAAV